MKCKTIAKLLVLSLCLATLASCSSPSGSPSQSPSHVPPDGASQSPQDARDQAVKEVTYTMKYKEYDGAFMNPLKGFRSNAGYGNALLFKNYETLVHTYVAWGDIEESADDTAQKIIDYCNEKWTGLEYTSCKVIPRVYLDMPHYAPGDGLVEMVSYGTTYWVDRRWPGDMEVGDYKSEEFAARLEQLIYKLGEAWDEHPLVAYVEMGIIGFWGEHHSPLVSAELQKVMGDAFTKAFKNKKVMVRRAMDFLDYEFGMYWDSFHHPYEDYQKEALLERGDLWRTQVIGGETAYNWGDFRDRLGEDPNDTLKTPFYRDGLIDTIREVHANCLGWVADYSSGLPEVREGAAEVQKALGYRFVINEATYTESYEDTFKVSLEVTNTGSSPLYYDWPIQFSLLADGKIRFKYTLNDFPLSSIMPGDDWNRETRAYDTAPESYTITAEFPVTGLEDGDYMLCVSVPEPNGGIPALRFANENYTVFAMTPLGWIGVGKSPDRHGLEGCEFKSQSEDDLFFRPR